MDFYKIANGFVHGENVRDYFVKGIRNPSLDIYAKIYEIFWLKTLIFVESHFGSFMAKKYVITF